MINAADFLKWLYIFNVNFGSSNIPIPVPLSYGGTGADLTASNGGIVYSGASSLAILAGTSTAHQMLQSGASGAPAWSTTVWPATSTINQILFSSANNVIGQISTVDNGVLISSATGVPEFLANGTPGYVLVANSGAPPSWQSLVTEGAITEVDGDAGNVFPTSGLITISGGITGLTTSGSGSTIDLTGILNLASGGTNANLTASNGGIFYSTGSAGAILAGTATASKMLLSGSSTTPSWSTSTIPTSAGATANKVLLSDGTNYVLSTPTFPNASATARKITVSDGTNWVASTETWAVPGSSGHVLQSDGTNWTSATPTGTGAPVLQISPVIQAPAIAIGLNDFQAQSMITFQSTNSSTAHFDFLNGTASVDPVLSVLGVSETNINFRIGAKGDGFVFLGANGNANGFAAWSPSSSVNFILAEGATAGNQPNFTAMGTDTDIGINIISKGIGGVAIRGIGTNTDAAAGYVGELITANIPQASSVSCTTDTARNIALISLTAGDWDVFGNVYSFFSIAGTYAAAWCSLTSGTLPDLSLVSDINLATGTLTTAASPTPYLRVSVSTTTNVYLSCQLGFGSGTGQACGTISARRVR